jgi:hypothetical protein
LRPLLIAAALVASTAAQADNTWTFSYTGAPSDAPFTIDSLDGSFTANDANGDGHITLAEVSALSFFGYQVAPGVPMPTPSGNDPSSELHSFSFDVGTQALSFTATAGSWHDAYEKTDTQLLYATGIGLFTFDLSQSTLTVRAPQLQFAQSAAPVPEPATWGLMALGLLGLAGWRRNRSAG